MNILPKNLWALGMILSVLFVSFVLIASSLLTKDNLYMLGLIALVPIAFGYFYGQYYGIKLTFLDCAKVSSIAVLFSAVPGFLNNPPSQYTPAVIVSYLVTPIQIAIVVGALIWCGNKLYFLGR